VNAVLPARSQHSSLLRDVQPRVVKTDDGVELYYEILEADRPDAPVLLLANGLGGKLYAWEPLLERFAGAYRIVTWDYRGLFRSSQPTRDKDLAIVHHAADAFRVLDAEGIKTATLIGWSMGVQVGLEAALQCPSRIDRLVLLNGTYGQAFQSALQPLTRVPFVPGLLHEVVERLLRDGSWVAGGIRALVRSDLHVGAVGAVLDRAFGNPRLKDMYRQYVYDVFGTSFPIYLRLFQELDAHSVYHLLPQITQPTLVISGGLDYLTPALSSVAIARRIPDAEHLFLPFGTHFALIEKPERVLPRIASCLQGD
jgi:3-oxoadipate enol-lactonase